MWFVYLLLLTLTPWAHAQRSLGAQAFQANVRPVLTGLLTDYYQMVAQFPMYPKEIVEVQSRVSDLAAAKVNLIQDCPGVMSSKCLLTIDDLRAKLQSVLTFTQATMAKLSPAPSLYLNGQEGLWFLYQVDAKTQEVKGILDNTSLMIQANVKHRNKSYPVVKQLDELGSLASLGHISFIPHPYQDDFRHFYFNFVNPIQTELPKTQNYEFMNRNLTYLNFALNLLNMNLTKRNKKTPEGMGPYLNTMHNRWNGLLRYYY